MRDRRRNGARPIVHDRRWVTAASGGDRRQHRRFRWLFIPVGRILPRMLAWVVA